MKTLSHTFVTLLFIILFSHTTLPPLVGSFPLSEKFPAVFNFGDSNSDTGELTSALGFLFGPSYGQTYFKPPSSGRFCNGRLIIDFLMEGIERPYLRAYLDSVSRESYRRGCNFAAGGSTIQKADGYSISPFGFDRQVSQFITFKSKALELIKQDKKFEETLPSEEYFYNGLYMFDIGQNDIAGAFYTKTLDQVLGFIPTFLDLFQDGIKNLYFQGARNFWIHNIGPIGCLAQMVTIFGKDKSKLDEFGCVIDHNKAAKFFNSKLRDLFQKLPQQFPDAHFTYVDIFSIKYELILHYTNYGFDHPIMVCCGSGGPPLNYNSDVNCGSMANINGTTVTAKPCNDSSKYVSWDGIHYTEAANRFVAIQFLTGKYSQTSSLLNF